MFNSDSPIKKLEEDYLGRAEFATILGDRIMNYRSPKNESVVIGIAGEWGSGKSSLMNMVLDHIKKEYIYSNNLEYEEKPIIMCFNPWRFSNQEQLISQFFYEMSLLLGGTDYANIKDVARKIELYASFFEPVGVALPPFGLFIKGLKKYLTSIRELADHKLNDLDNIRRELNNDLKRQNHKIIIALDDIDRLNTGEIHLIFQLIKILANFPNTIYLVGFDREVVSAALGDEQKNLSGSDYLEKIIQVIFEVPYITEKEIKELVIKNLVEEFERFKSTEDRYYFDNLYDSLLKYKFRNIRNLNRYINTLKITYDPIEEDVFYVDFYAFTAIHVFFPEVYQFIKKNRELLLVDYNFSDYGPNKEEIKKELDGHLNSLIIPNIPHPDIKNFLIELFPNLKRIYSNWDNRNYASEWKLKKRICTKENFDTYFKFTVPTWEISKKEFDKIVYSETNDMVNSLLNLPQQLQIKFMYNLKNVVLNEYYPFDENDRKNIIECLFCIGDILKYETDLYSPVYMIIGIINSLLQPIDPKTSYDILKNSIGKSISLNTICEVSYELFIRSEKNEGRDSKLIDIDLEKSQIDTLRSIVIKKIAKNLHTKGLNGIKNPFYVLLILKELGGEKELDEYMENIDEDNLLILMSNLIKKDDLNEHSISKALDNLNKLISIKCLNRKFNGILSSNQLNKKELDMIKSFNNVILMESKPKSFVESLNDDD